MRKKAQYLIVALLAIVALTVANSAYAKTGTIKPGWGFGDDNHIHIGPPGHSVFPGDGDHDADDSDNNNALKLYILHFVNIFSKFQHDWFASFKFH